MVYMQGLPTHGRLTDPEGKRNGWNSDPNDGDNRDLNFFDAVYDSLCDQINTNRVYSTGHSNGGSFTYCLWAVRGDLFAAMAPSGALSVPAMKLMKSKPAMHIAGKTDPLVTLIHPGGHKFPKEAPELIVRFFKSCDRK